MRDPDFAALRAADERLGEKALTTSVAPFYLKLMGTRIISAEGKTLRRVGRCSQKVTFEQVRLMLHGTWRPLAMGSWYAIAHDDETFTGALHDALETCLGRLTSPGLIAAVLFYPSERTLPLLEEYAATDRERDWGAADLADAASRHIRRAELPRGDTDAAQATAQLEALLARGAQLRHFQGRRMVW